MNVRNYPHRDDPVVCNLAILVSGWDSVGALSLVEASKAGPSRSALIYFAIIWEVIHFEGCFCKIQVAFLQEEAVSCLIMASNGRAS